MIWHSTTPDEVLAELGVDHKTGLANGVADERLKDYGKNVVTQTERPTFIQRFFSQLKSKVVIILIITALVSFVVSLMYDEVNSYSPLLIIAIVIMFLEIVISLTKSSAFSAYSGISFFFLLSINLPMLYANE